MKTTVLTWILVLVIALFPWFAIPFLKQTFHMSQQEASLIVMVLLSLVILVSVISALRKR